MSGGAAPLEVGQQIAVALQAHLKRFATAQTPPLRVGWEGISFRPAADAIHLEDHLLPGRTGGPVLSNAVAEHVGIYQVDVDAPASAHPADVRRLADAVMAAFPRGAVLMEEGVRVTIRGHPSRGPLLPGDGRQKVPISITYHSTAVRA